MSIFFKLSDGIIVNLEHVKVIDPNRLWFQYQELSFPTLKDFVCITCEDFKRIQYTILNIPYDTIIDNKQEPENE